ncbi:hypothetical protein [Actinokineospora sp. HUAS TT18]|uniref:hypothetical protein n=1 Tax=Actinokineospora sp. HUAS TT18 TaxID=3447451 RepID=UPI003F5284F0
MISRAVVISDWARVVMATSRPCACGPVVSAASDLRDRVLATILSKEDTAEDAGFNPLERVTCRLHRRSMHHCVSSRSTSSCLGGALGRRQMASLFDRAIAAPHRGFDNESEVDPARGMHPTRWDRFFQDFTTLADVYRSRPGTSTFTAPN